MKRLFCVLIFSFIVISCQLNPFIGVGASVDTVAPVLNISSHENFQYVSGSRLYLYGTCSDNLKVTSTLLKAEHNDELLFTWEIKNPVSPWSYQIRLNPEADIKAQLAAGTAAEDFELPDGEYKFTVFARDANDNTSNSSYDTRTLVVDNEPSVAEITYPPLKTSLSFYVGDLSRAQTGGADPYDFNNSEYFRNGDFYIQGNIDDNYGIANLTLTLTEYDNTGNETDKTLSVNFDSSMEPKVKSNIDKHLLDVDTSKKPTSLWNWKVWFRETAKTEDDINTARYYKVSIKVKDSAGNIEEDEKGFLCVLPRTDYPYTIFPGYGDKIPVGTPLSGTCYDDDGIKSVKLSLCNVAGEVIEGKEDFYDENVVAGANTYTWKMDKSIPVTGGSYIIKVQVTDINGKESGYIVNEAGDYLHDEQYRERKLNVIDLTAPSVDISAKQGKDENAKSVDFDVYSDVVDKSGDFQVSVKVTDASQVSKVYMARVLTCAAEDDVAKLSEIDSKTGNVNCWDLSSDATGIKFYNLYEYSAGNKALPQVTVSRAFNVYNDFDNEFATKRFYIYAENASGKTTVTFKSLLKEEERPQITVLAPAQGSTLTVPFDVSLEADDFTGIDDLTIECSQNGKALKKIAFADLKNDSSFKKDGGKIIITKLSSDKFGDKDKFESGSCTLAFTAKDNYGNSTIEKQQFYVEKDAPYIRNVTVAKNVATYKVGDTIKIRVEMSKQVSVSNGIPTLGLNNGGIAKYSGIDKNYLIFDYTVEDGHDTELLNCTGIALNGASIADDQNMEMGTGVFPAEGIGSLATNATIKIDTKKPTVYSIKSLTANGFYKAGSVIEIQVIFSENVDIDTANGIPGLKLNIANRYAQYDPSHSGNSKNKAVFVYTVQDGDIVDTLAWEGWEQNKAVITDFATGAGGKGNEFAFSDSDVSYQWANKLVIDTTAPQVKKIESSFTSSDLSLGGCFDGTYYYCNEGKQINLDVTFSETVKVSGTASLSLNSSGSTTAVYSAGSGTNKLSFIYTVAAGDNTDGILEITKVNGVIRDNAGNGLIEIDDSVGKIKDNGGNDKKMKIDTKAPNAPLISLTKDANAKNATGTAVYTEMSGGKTVGVTVVASNIAEDTYSYCWEENGTMVDNYTKYNGTISGTFGDGENEGFYQEYSICLRLKDKAGNESERSLTRVFVIDTDKPELTKAAPSAVINNALKTTVTRSYTKGEEIYISLVFNKEVTASGVKVKLNNTKEVELDNSTTHITGSADYYLTGIYKPGSNEQLDESLYITEVCTGTVKDCLNNTLDCKALDDTVKASGFENINASQEIKIDSVAPKISSVSSSKTDGWYTVGAIIPITVVFSEDVEFTGAAPTLVLSNGAVAHYVSGSGTKNWIFNYEVKNTDKDTGDSAANASFLKASKITGQIIDLAGAPQKGNALASTTVPTANNFSGNKIGIDTTPPAALNLKAVYSSDPDKAVIGETVSGNNGTAYITVSCNSQTENGATFYVTENGEIKNNWNTSFDNITCKPADGEVLTYTIAAKQRDRAGNISEETGITFTIDNSSIILESITTSHANGTCKANDEIELSLNFNKDVRVEQDITLTLNATNSGGSPKTVTISSSNSYSKTLTAIYKVANGDVTAEVLNVSGLSGKVVDKLESGLTLDAGVLSAATNLAATKQITIDTTAPTLKTIATTATNGWYKAGDAIAVILTFDEDVKIGSTKPALAMSSGGTATYLGGSGQTMNFIYTVADGNTTGKNKDLKVKSISGAILDMAGNAFGKTLPNGANFNGKTIGIDTQINKISILCADGTVPTGSYLETKILKISGLTDSGSGIKQIECTVNGESKTLSPTDGTASLECAAVSNANTNYTVAVKATDNAGNVSSAKVSFAIDGEEIKLESITTTTASGTYNAGTVIPVTLTFNKEVKVTSKLILTLSNNKTLEIPVNSSAGKTLTKEYKVASGDDCESLNVLKITGSVADSRPKSLSSFDLKNVTTIVDTHSINIDTKVPTVVGITTTASKGWYNADRNIQFIMECSETVNVTGTPTLTLSSDGKAQYLSGSGSKNLVFVYTVASGDSTGQQESISVTGFSGTIADIAKNSLSTGIPSNNYPIGIDTIVPKKLEIGGITNGSTVANAERLYINNFGENTDGSGISGYTININGTSATVGGSLSGTLLFKDLPYNLKQNLTVAEGGRQSFAVYAYQTDKAGNRSAVSETLNFTIDANKAKLVSVTSSKSNETCKEGTKIEISLKFSRPIKSGSPVITLSNGVKLSGGTWSIDSETYTAVYTIGTSSTEDTAGAALKITEITGEINDGLELQYMGSLWNSSLASTDLSSYKVVVDTVAPTLKSSSYTYNSSTGKATLTYQFSENISKVIGKKITLTREAYAVPIVLSVSEYNEFYALQSSIAGFYEKTVNGFDKTANKADSTAKYVLKYEYDPTDTILKNYFNAMGYYKQEIVMESSAVSVSGNTVTVTTDELMTGESYTVNVDSGIVKDSVGHSCANIPDKTFTSGNKPQPPVIRVNKISGRGSTASSTTMKIDTVTKGATVYYNLGSYFTESPATSYAANANGSVTWRGTNYKGVRISSSSSISAKAVKNGESSGVSYEKAFKTVINTLPASTSYGNEGSIQFYVFRGGDRSSGSNSVDNFPMTWDEKSVPSSWSSYAVNDTLERELAKYGMLLADGKTATTWGVTDKLYFHGLGCKVSGNMLLWKWQESSAISVSAGGTATDTNKMEQYFHDRSGANKN